MAGLLGAVGPFERDTDDWTAYCERLQQFFVANEIKEDGKKRAVLLSVCGTASYQLIRSLVAPSKPTDKSVDEIMKLVKDHLTLQPSSIVQRFKFNSRSQQDTEIVSQFVAELKKLSEYCEFGESHKYAERPAGMWSSEREGASQAVGRRENNLCESI